MKLYYDFHIHSCLSPCGSDDMTPNNIVGMAALSGYNIIALTDHNCCKNCEAAVKVGKANGITVIPGMELCTSEEIHIVCLFPTVEKAMKFSDYVEENSMDIPNNPEIFGNQLIMNEDDEVVGIHKGLLTIASNISVENVKDIVESFGGICYPAHLNRDSYSIISVLGGFPTEQGFTVAEFSDGEKIEAYTKLFGLENLKIIRSSDAHYLENIPDAEHQIELEENSAECLIKYLR